MFFGWFLFLLGLFTLTGVRRKGHRPTEHKPGVRHKNRYFLGDDYVSKSTTFSQIDVPDALGDVVNSIDKGISCKSCKELLRILQKFSDTDELFVQSGKDVCRVIQPVLRSTREEICREGVQEHGPLLAQALRTIMDVETSQAANLLCNNFLQVCTVTMPRSGLTLPPRPEVVQQKPEPSSSLGSYKVVHFSDLHVDPLYTVGAAGECDNPVLCCRNITRPLHANITGTESSPAGPFGFSKRCDAPRSLEESMYQAIHKLVPNARHVIFTGDVVERQVWQSSRESNTMRIKATYDTMKNYFPKFFPAVGNHESSPTNWFPAYIKKTVEKPPFPAYLWELRARIKWKWNRVLDRFHHKKNMENSYNIKWLYSLLTSVWKNTDPGNVVSKYYRGRYVYLIPNKKLRIIGLNTNMYYFLNLWLYREPLNADPDGQFKWLVAELAKAEKAQHQVWIVGHMPMGDVDVITHSSSLFNDIITRYKETVGAMFFGHTHMDQYQINYGRGNQTADKAMIMSYIAPSLTPSNGFPAFRVYTVDEASHAVLDSKTYFTNMSEPSFQVDPVWEPLYSVKNAYARSFSSQPGVPESSDSHIPLSASRWHELTETWKVNPDYFDVYWKNKHTGSDDIQPCNDACRQKEICLIRGGRSEDNCAGKDPKIKFGRQHKRNADEDGSGSGSGSNHEDEQEHQHVSHCGSSILLDALEGLFDSEVQAKLRKVVPSRAGDEDKS
ncbi:hypothetical protein E4U21_003992 [Claviceps maximensis]|nr:hypothetical protein E4U21_003992 [Claviceps maximensis]